MLSGGSSANTVRSRIHILFMLTLFGNDFLSCDMMSTARASPLLLPVTRSPRNLNEHRGAAFRLKGKTQRMKDTRFQTPFSRED